MLEAICKFLHGCGSADDGVETVLSPIAFKGLLELVKAVYGNHAATVVDDAFVQREDKSIVCVVEDIEASFRLCLTGRG